MSLEHTQPLDPVPSPAAIAADIGRRMARIAFEKRGNKFEAHLKEPELGACIAAAAQVAVERYIELSVGTLRGAARKPPKRA